MKRHIYILFSFVLYLHGLAQNTSNVSGSFDIGPIGNATYNIPIDLPPGTAGLQPNISIVYNSFSGDVNPAKRNAMVVKNEKRFLKQKRNALKNPGYSRHPVKTQASFKRLLNEFSPKISLKTHCQFSKNRIFT